MTFLKDYNDVKGYLYSLKTQKSKYGIDRMALLSQMLNHPEQNFPIIHVAGTNGKGSTCAMLEAIYRAAGFRTGMFTSPHLVYIGERIQVNRERLSPQKIVEYTRLLKIIADQLAEKDVDNHPSFFEFMTAMAFLHFMHEKIDICILETGLGGRLDSTNIVNPMLSIITSISLDHCEILGDTIPIIAGEKAAIIKRKKPAVTGSLPLEAEAVVQEYAQKQQSPIYSIQRYFSKNGNHYPETNLPGNYQRRNAAMALLSTIILKDRFPVSETIVRKALLNVNWAGRWDKYTLEDDKKLILDASHNPEGIAFLIQSLENQMQEDKQSPIIIAGTLGLSRAKALMPAVSRFAQQIFLVQPQQSRACSFEELEATIPDNYSGKVHRTTISELFPYPRCCTVGIKGSTIVVAGSIYLIGEVFEAIFHGKSPQEQNLQDSP